MLSCFTYKRNNFFNKDRQEKNKEDNYRYCANKLNGYRMAYARPVDSRYPFVIYVIPDSYKNSPPMEVLSTVSPAEVLEMFLDTVADRIPPANADYCTQIERIRELDCICRNQLESLMTIVHETKFETSCVQDLTANLVIWSGLRDRLEGLVSKYRCRTVMCISQSMLTFEHFLGLIFKIDKLISSAINRLAQIVPKKE